MSEHGKRFDEALDKYITGNYGEDNFIEEEEDKIYSIIPPENIDKEYIKNKWHIRNFLRDRKGKFFRAKTIALLCGFPNKETCVEVRNAITILIEKNNEPIIATSKGFGYATNIEDIKNYADQLEKRQMGLQRRINKVKEIYYKEVENGNLPKM